MRKLIFLPIGLFVLLVLLSVIRLQNGFSRIEVPLPDFLSQMTNKQVSTLDVWLPRIDQVSTSVIPQPEISATGGLVYDLTTEKTLFAKNPGEKLPVASLTKVMTAIVALEHRVENDRYIVEKEALVGENSMGLSTGEILTLEELLYGVMLVSGNDASEVLARNYPYGRNAFIEAMNEKVKSLGLSNTNFTNPSGLQGDGDQFSTAYDLLVISRFAITNFPLFKKVVAEFQQEIPYTQYHKYFYLENETNLISSYPGVKGIKTGFTPEAGLCLITYLEHERHQIIAILLGSSNRRQEMKDVLDYSLKTLGFTPPPHG